VPLLDELSSRIAGRAPKRRLRLLLRGTDFQFQVWRWLLSVPPGCAISYSELARRAGCPTAVRAVASCMASNPIAFLIPCHRVIRNSGHIGEYRWGARIKAQLLEREGYRPETYL
jgi:AraC family transcriptional regulator of adaptative response/methylated-DNA-[protein]-cysteine methyltransferase